MSDKTLEQAENRLPVGFGGTVRTLLFETKLCVAHKKGVLRARRYSGGSELKLQFGCGPILMNGRVKTDVRKKADLKLDLRKPLPFANGSCVLVYPEHSLEHLDYPEPVLSLLKECFRVLKPRGVFNVVVPDIELVLRPYVQGGWRNTTPRGGVGTSTRIGSGWNTSATISDRMASTDLLMTSRRSRIFSNGAVLWTCGVGNSNPAWIARRGWSDHCMRCA